MKRNGGHRGAAIKATLCRVASRCFASLAKASVEHERDLRHISGAVSTSSAQQHVAGAVIGRLAMNESFIVIHLIHSSLQSISFILCSVFHDSFLQKL